ncbi:hypothetical protein G6F31_020123 [Rhizopus arrhizus]|nr:hypothetical protein G6F31_020123 [Rhizopus arrhizus]
MMDPVHPPPMIATSTAGKVLAMLVSRFHRMSRGVGDGYRLAGPDDAVPFDIVGERRERAREPHQLPAHHVGVAAVQRIGEEAFDGGVQQGLEEHVGWQGRKIRFAGLQVMKPGVLPGFVQFGERFAVLLAGCGIQRSQAAPDHLGGRE